MTIGQKLTTFSLLFITLLPCVVAEKINKPAIFLDEKTVPSLSYALSNAVDGSIIFLKAGVYQDGGVLKANFVTITGEPGTHIRDFAAKGKGALVINGNDATVMNIECSAIRVRDKNGACIRLQGKNLTVKNVYFHDSQQGILSGKNSGNIVIEDSRFERLGYGGRAHGIYIGSGQLYIHNSVFVSAKGQGHEIKSRAAKTIISNTTIASLSSEDSRLVDIPNGGELSISNSVLQQGSNTSNWNMIGYGLEGITHKKNSVSIKRNIFVLDRQGGSLVFQKKGNIKQISLIENAIVGKYHNTSLSEDNFIYKNRSAAGLKAFPFLPKR